MGIIKILIQISLFTQKLETDYSGIENLLGNKKKARSYYIKVG